MEFQPLTADRMPGLVTTGLGQRQRKGDSLQGAVWAVSSYQSKGPSLHRGNSDIVIHKKSFLPFRVRGLETFTEAEYIWWMFRYRILGICCSQHFGNCQEYPALRGYSVASSSWKTGESEMRKFFWENRSIIKSFSNSREKRHQIWVTESPLLANSFPLTHCLDAMVPVTQYPTFPHSRAAAISTREGT